MSESQSKRSSQNLVKDHPTRKTALVLNTCTSSATSLADSASSSASDPCRKKSGFVITRIDKASISSALENESDVENEYNTDRGGSGAADYRSPGSSSQVSDGSSIFEDGTSPMEKSRNSQIQDTKMAPSATTVRATSMPPPSQVPTVKRVPAPLNIPPQDQSILPAVLFKESASALAGSSATPKSGKDMPSSISSSRFHIIKIDAGPYKRGRWNCRDFDEEHANGPVSTIRSDLIALGGGTRSCNSDSSSGRASYIAEENGRQGTDGQQTPVALLGAVSITTNITDQNQHQEKHVPSISHRESSPMLNGIHKQSYVSSIGAQKQNSSPFPNMQSTQIAPGNIIPAHTGVDFNNAAAAILDSIIVGSRHRQSTDHLLGSVSNQDIGEGSMVSHLNSADTDATAGSSSQNAGGGVVAIDNKIEQAMDLVKTHLLYAVREEVEVLKEKIIDLEKKVFRLETENKLLREYAPPEILQQIQQPLGVGQTIQTIPNPPTAIGQQGAQQQQTEPPSKPGISASLSTGAIVNGSPATQQCESGTTTDHQ